MIKSKILKKDSSGITLIALIVTIIVLLILAGVTISSVVGNNGIIKKATEAKIKSKQSIEEEYVNNAALAATVDAKSLFKYGIEKNILEKELQVYFGNEASVTEDGDYFIYEGEYKKYLINKDGTVLKEKISQNDKNKDAIIYVDGRYILRKNGVLSTWDWAIDNSNEYDKIIEYNPQKNNETIIAENVENFIYDNDSRSNIMYIITKDGTISILENDVFKLENIIKYEIPGQAANSYAIDDDGKLYTWGIDSEYKIGLGNGTMEVTKTPVCINDVEGSALKNKKVMAANVGAYEGYAIDDAGKLYTWGENTSGRLGNGTTDDFILPTCISDIENSPLFGKKIIEFNYGPTTYNRRFSYAKDSEGKIYMWGENWSGSLGIGTDENAYLPICLSDVDDSVLYGKKIVYIGVIDGVSAMGALDDEGNVYTWGRNHYGSLGNGTMENSLSPICINNIEGSALNGNKIISLMQHGNNNNVYALDEKGKLYTWGINSFGELGNGKTGKSLLPVCISDIEGSALKNKKISQLIIDHAHVLAIDSEKNLYGWGLDYLLGLDDNFDTTIPICLNKIEGNVLFGKKIKSVEYAEFYNVIYDIDNIAYTVLSYEDGILRKKYQDINDQVVEKGFEFKQYPFGGEFYITENGEYYYKYKYIGYPG